MTHSNSIRYPVITIDGPSGSGKGTVCWRLAQELDYRFLDSGALYRIVGFFAHQAGLLNHSSDDLPENDIAQLTKSLNINFILNHTTKNIDINVNNQHIGDQIRNETVGHYASQVAALPKVRQNLLALQQNMAASSGLIADGRDMGTVVFPNADAKIFLTASATARAKRRFSQLTASGQTADYQDILEKIQQRDKRDEQRAVAPSLPAPDALIIDSSEMDIETVYELIKSHCQSKGICF